MKFISYALATALSISTTSPVVADKPECKTIVEIAKEVDELSTLVTALTAADLVDTLSGDGPFTVFAPLDTGFGALPEGTVANLLEPENKAKLTGLLLRHVVGGKVKSDDLVDGPVTTLNGDVVTVDVTDKGIKIDDAYVKKADIEACNGIIHVIDKVLLPAMPKEPETSSPTDTLNSKSGKSTVAKASKAGSTSAKAGKSDTDKMKTSPSAKAGKSDTDKMKTTAKAAGKSDTDKMKTSSAKAVKATTTTSAKAAKGADESDVPEEPEEPEEPKAEDESDKAEEEEEKEEEEEEKLSLMEGVMEILGILFYNGKRKLSNHLRG